MRTTGLAALWMLTACGAVDDSEAFPTGVFAMNFAQTASTCSGDLQTGTLTATISIDDTGTYYLSALGGDIPANSQSAEHLTFITAPTNAELPPAPTARPTPSRSSPRAKISRAPCSRASQAAHAPPVASPSPSQAPKPATDVAEPSRPTTP